MISVLFESKMDFLHIILTSLATTLLLIVLAFLSIILKTFIGKSIKNPQYAPVVGTVFSQLYYFNTLHDYFTDIAYKHPTFRLIGPDSCEIYTADTRNIEHVLKTNFDNYSKGEENKDALTDLFGNGIFAADGVKWKQQRKLASYEFSTRVLRDFSCSVFRKNAAKLVGIVSKFAEANKVFDVQDLVMKSSLDSIFQVGFGVDLNCLNGSSKEGSAFIKAFDDSNAFTYWRLIDPFWKLKKFFNIGCEASLRKNIKFINDLLLNLISKRRKQLETNQHSNEREDILSRFLIESKKDARMDDQYLMDIILNFVFAGKDSSGNTLSWFFYVLCKNPLVLAKVVSEIEEVVGKQENGSKIEDFVEKINDQVLEKMHYLHATLTETLRLYPAVPTDGRVADMDDILPDGFKLNKGDGVYYISYAMGRMSYIWGDDAHDFKPERWLNDNGVFQPESPFKFIAFHVVPGCDMAGVVVAKGDSVSKFNIGDEVYGNIQDFNNNQGQLKSLGTLAQFILVEDNLVTLKPKNISFEEAASLPLAAQTAVEGFKKAGFRHGMDCFVVGGSGGVGTLVVQLAKQVFGASKVVATCSTSKVEFVKSLGVDKIYDYTKTRYDEIEERYDMVYDTIGNVFF